MLFLFWEASVIWFDRHFEIDPFGLTPRTGNGYFYEEIMNNLYLRINVHVNCVCILLLGVHRSRLLFDG